jgi:hypothetical protein
LKSKSPIEEMEGGEGERSTQSDSEQITNENSTNLTFSFNNYRSEYRHYLESFNAIVVNKVKQLVMNAIEKNEKEIIKANKPAELSIYEEVTRHLYRFELLLNQQFTIGIENKLENVDNLISNGNLNEHSPVFLYGSSLTGKTATLVEMAKIFYNKLTTVGSSSDAAHDKCVLIVRFVDYTLKSSMIDGLLLTICEQLAVLTRSDAFFYLKNKNFDFLIEYFYEKCKELTKLDSSPSLLILIDGLQDDIHYINNSQTFWLLNGSLPPKVHLIATIKKHLINKSDNDSESELKNKDFISNSFIESITKQNKKINSQKSSNDNLFELPFIMNEMDSSQFATTIQAKFNNTFNSEIIEILFNKKNETFKNLQPPIKASDINQITAFFLYFQSIVNELKMGQKTKQDLTIIQSINKKDCPQDVESFIRLKLSNN